MKQLYIRVGNSEATKRVLIIGEEQSMGERDLSGYRPSKGEPFIHMVESDPYSGNRYLTYIHATPNIDLDSPLYRRDYDVHEYIKHHCKDLVTWDGEANEGLVRSREAFIVNSGLDPDLTARNLYLRLEKEIHRKNLPASACRLIERKVRKELRADVTIKDIETLTKFSKDLVDVFKVLKH